MQRQVVPTTNLFDLSGRVAVVAGGNGGIAMGLAQVRNSTAEEAADYMSQNPHWAVLIKFTKELGWDDV